MLGGILGSVAGSVVGGLFGNNSAKKAANAQTRAADAQIALQREQYDNQVERFEPYYGAGTNALAAANFEMGLGDRPEGYAGMTMSPQAQFALEQGVDQIEAGAALSGGMNSGRTLRALEGYRNALALSDRDTQMNRLLGLSQTGQQAAGLIGNASTNLTQGNTNALSNIGNAQAASSIAQGNNFQNMINTGLRWHEYGNALSGTQPQTAAPSTQDRLDAYGFPYHG